jgi:2-methylcitrate dehydratase
VAGRSPNVAGPTRTPTVEVVEELARWSTDLDYGEIPSHVLERLKLHLIDAIGCGLGGADGPPSRASRVVASELAPTGPCSLIGARSKTSVDLATFANSVAIRYLDYCDVYLGVEVTPPAANLPAILALAEAQRADGTQCLLGAAVLYESLLRLCSSGSLHERGWDTVTFGAIASALASAKMLGLDLIRTRHALSIATVHSPALLQTRVGELSMWKGAASAYAARNGVFAAYLARAGMTGPSEVFEGQRGFRRQVLDNFALSAMEWRTPEVLIKRFPAQVFTQAAIEAAILLHAQAQFGVADIDGVTVHTFARAIAGAANGDDRWAPETRETADHSLPFVVASALLDGELTSAQFAQEKVMAPTTRELMRLVHVVEEPAMTASFPNETPARVEIRLRDGRQFSEEVRVPLGHPKRPMDRLDLSKKFRSLATSVVGEAKADRILNRIGDLETLRDVRELTAMVAVDESD